MRQRAEHPVWGWSVFQDDGRDCGSGVGCYWRTGRWWRWSGWGAEEADEDEQQQERTEREQPELGMVEEGLGFIGARGVIVCRRGRSDFFGSIYGVLRD